MLTAEVLKLVCNENSC